MLTEMGATGRLNDLPNSRTEGIFSQQPALFPAAVADFEKQKKNGLVVAKVLLTAMSTAAEPSSETGTVYRKETDSCLAIRHGPGSSPSITSRHRLDSLR